MSNPTSSLQLDAYYVWMWYSDSAKLSATFSLISIPWRNSFIGHGIQHLSVTPMGPMFHHCSSPSHMLYVWNIYLFSFTPFLWASFVGIYSSTMEHMGLNPAFFTRDVGYWSNARRLGSALGGLAFSVGGWLWPNHNFYRWYKHSINHSQKSGLLVFYQFLPTFILVHDELFLLQHHCWVSKNIFRTPSFSPVDTCWSTRIPAMFYDHLQYRKELVYNPRTNHEPRGHFSRNHSHCGICEQNRDYLYPISPLQLLASPFVIILFNLYNHNLI